MRVYFDELRAPLYLMPLTAEAVLLYHILKNHGITVSGFLDNGKTLHGKAYRDCVISCPDNPDIDRNSATVVLCSLKYQSENNEQLRTLGFSNIIRMEQLLKEEFIDTAINQIDRDSLHALSPRQTRQIKTGMMRNIRKCLLPDSAHAHNALVLNSADIVVTEKCTLKCRGCVNLMHYFKTPQHSDLEEMCKDIDILMQNVDFVRRLVPIGGEVLLYKQLPALIDHINKYQNNIGSICVLTNGTLVPSGDMLKALKTDKIVVEISDYGNLSTKREKLIQTLSDNNIEYTVGVNIKWRDVQRIVAGDTENTQVKYENCTMPCLTIKYGRFYRCPFLAHGDTLNAFPHHTDNYVPLDETCTKEAIRTYLEKDQAPPGCGYCCGYTPDSPAIPTAEQIKTPLEYHVFDGEQVSR